MDTEKLLSNLMEYEYYDYPFDYFIQEKLQDDTYFDDVFDMTNNQLLNTLDKKICLGPDTETITKNIKDVLTVLTYSKKRYINTGECLSTDFISHIPTEHCIIDSIKSNADFI